MGWNQRPRDPQQQRGFDLIGASIRRKRIWLDWTQRMLEAQAGIDQSVISRLENGKQYGLRWRRFADIVAALDGFDLVMPSEDRTSRGSHAPARTVVDLERGSGDDDLEDENDDDAARHGP